MFIKIFDTLYNTNNIKQISSPREENEYRYIVSVDFFSSKSRYYHFKTKKEADAFYLQIENKLIP